MGMRSDLDFSRPQICSPISRVLEVVDLLACRILPKNCLQANFIRRFDAITQDSEMVPLSTLIHLSLYHRSICLVNIISPRSMKSITWGEEVRKLATVAMECGRAA